MQIQRHRLEVGERTFHNTAPIPNFDSCPSAFAFPPRDFGLQTSLGPRTSPSGLRSAFELRLSNSGRHTRAFTLIEVLISASLMALILASAYFCLNAAMRTQKLIDPRVDAIQTARVALALMSADLRNACPLSPDFDLLGMQRSIGKVEADNLDFATHNYTPRRPREGDSCEESFFLDKDPHSGQLALWRRRNPAFAPDPLSGGYREELAHDVCGLRFEYYDGVQWYDTWGDINGLAKSQTSLREHDNLMGLPEAVRITLLLTPENPSASNSQTAASTNQPPLYFQTVVRLTLADSSLTAPSAGATNAAAPASSQPEGSP